MKFSTLPYSVRLILYTMVIAVVTRIGILFSFVNGEITQMWSPTGLSLVLLFLNGDRFLPAVFMGVALNYLFILPSAPFAVILAAGASMEAYIGFRLLKKTNFDHRMHSLAELGKLILISGLISTFVNALFSVSWYAVFNPLVADSFLTVVLLWAMGNLVGVIVIAPLLLIAATRRFERWNNRRILEFVVLCIVVAVLSYNVFHAKFFSTVLNYSLAFILFPFAVVGAIRFGMTGSVIVTFIIALNATLSTQTRMGLFADGEYSSGIILVDLFLIVVGTTSLALASLIEERSAAEQKIRASEERNRIVTERTGQLIYDYNVESGLIQWSGAIREVTHYSPDEFSIVNIKGWLENIHPDDRARAEEELLTAMRLHTEFKTEYRFRRKDGTYIDILDRGAFLYHRDTDIVAYRMLGTMSDITANNSVVRRLQESEERYKIFSMLTSDYIYSAAVTSTGFVTEWASDAFQRITGYSVDEMNEPEAWNKVIHPDDISYSDGVWSDVQQGEPVIAEYRVITKTGDVRWLRDYVRPVVKDAAGSVLKVMGGVQDITDRKQAEERFRILIERIADGILLFNNRGYITFVSTSATNIIGYLPEELMNRSIFSILHPSEAKKYAFKFGRLTVEYDRSEYLLGRFKHKNGEWVYIEGMVTNLFNNPSVNSFVANFRNVTDRINREEELRRSLQEKEILLKEVHHRVKNNMQVISSLLNLQSASLKDKASVALFRESQNRIKSMSLVHEILYQSQDIASVNFSVYAKQLIASLQKSFGAKTGSVTIAVRIGTIDLMIDEAIPCGLIINELVSNALKYAFPKNRSGEIVVEMRKKRGRLVQLAIRDNGIGMVKRPADSPSLGLKLVQALTDQLKGTMIVENKRGTSITVEFPYHQTTDV